MRESSVMKDLVFADFNQKYKTIDVAELMSQTDRSNSFVQDYKVDMDTSMTSETEASMRRLNLNDGETG